MSDTSIQLNVRTVIFQTIQFNVSSFKCQRVLFDTKIGLFQLLPLRARVNLGAVAMKGYSEFPKAPALLKPHSQIV